MIELYRAVFASFDARSVRYLVIGGIAAIVHGVPRATFDLDVLIEATLANATQLLEAPEEAGLGTAALTPPQEVLEHSITVFEDRVRIDVQTDTPGIVFADAWARRQTVDLRGVPVQVVCLADLIASKRAAGRPRDLEDVRALLGETETD